MDFIFTIYSGDDGPEAAKRERYEHAGKTMTTTTMMTTMTRNKIIRATSTVVFPGDGSNGCIGGNRSAGTHDCCTTDPC